MFFEECQCIFIESQWGLQHQKVIRFRTTRVTVWLTCN